MSRLVLGLVLDHDLRAFSAAATALRASSSPAAEHFQRVFWSRGETTSKVEDNLTSCPSSQRGIVEEGSKAEERGALPLAPLEAMFEYLGQFGWID